MISTGVVYGADLARTDQSEEGIEDNIVCILGL